MVVTHNTTKDKKQKHTDQVVVVMISEYIYMYIRKNGVFCLLEKSGSHKNLYSKGIEQ